jgi:hypothetical protein
VKNLERAVVVLVLTITSASPVFAQWGDLKIKFKLTKAMPLEAVAAPKQHPDCTDVPVFDSKAVGPNLEVPNVMMWLNVSDASTVKVHPTLAEKTAAEKPTLKMRGCQILPHCLFATAGQTLLISNEDAFNYRPYLGLVANVPVSPIIPGGRTFEKEVMKAEKLPQMIVCNIHPNSFGYVMVAPTPYHGVSDAEGVVTMKDLPIGKWEFKFWHEVHGSIASVVRGGQPETWPKGVTSIAIAEGENDQGEILIVPKE